MNASRYPLAVLAGLLLAGSFPKPGVAGLAWVAPGMLIALALGQRAGEAFRIGYLAGLAHYLASLYWLLLIPVKWFPILGWLALSAYLALYPAVWAWMMTRASGFEFQVSGTSPVESGSMKVALAVSTPSWTKRLLWTIFGAALWVALEMTVSRLFSGFPWNLLGASQFRLVPLIQIASLTGIYGVSFLVVWSSLSLLCAAAVVLARPAMRSAWIGEIILPFSVMVGMFVFGFNQLARQPAAPSELKVTFVQPDIPQMMIWDENQSTNRFRQLIELTAHALTNETDLLLWPEAAVPKLIRYDEETLRAITGLARSNRVWMIVGSDDTEPREDSPDPDATADFNSSFLVSPKGELAARYCKRNLVIFGEYIPLVRWLPFVKWFTPITGGFTSGDKPVTFELERWGERPREPKSEEKTGSPAVSPHRTARTSTLICFEDVFPHLVREYADTDTDFLVNLTNDGWFGESAEQWQHAAGAAFRAVENGVPLLRCCNNGVTCWIDANGRLREVFSDERGSVYGAGFMTARIPLLSEKRTPSFYNRHGDWFGWGCVIFSAALAVRQIVIRKKGW